MRKKLYLISILIVTLIGVTAIFTTLLLLSYRTNFDSDGDIPDSYPVYFVPYLVSKGTVNEYKVCNASIEAINDEEEIVAIKTKSGLLSNGEYCSAGTTVGDYTLNFTGRVLEIINNGENDTIKLINYNNRKFVIYIDNSELNFFNYGSEHTIYVGNSICKAKVTYIDLLLEESTKDAVKIELEIKKDSLCDNKDLFLLLGSTATIRYDSKEQLDALRVFKSVFAREELIKGNLVNVVVKKKSTSKFITTLVQIGTIGDSYVQIICDEIEEGDVICV